MSGIKEKNSTTNKNKHSHQNQLHEKTQDPLWLLTSKCDRVRENEISYLYYGLLPL